MSWHQIVSIILLSFFLGLLVSAKILVPTSNAGKTACRIICADEEATVLSSDKMTLRCMCPKTGNKILNSQQVK